MYRVKFFDLEEQTKGEFDYDSLFDALRVAKETDIGPDRLHSPAMSDAKFNEQFVALITSGFVYAGQKTPEFPDGKFMIMLLSVDEDRVEKPIISNPMVIAFPHIPVQHKSSYARPSGSIINETRSKS